MIRWVWQFNLVSKKARHLGIRKLRTGQASTDTVQNRPLGKGQHSHWFLTSSISMQHEWCHVQIVRMTLNQTCLGHPLRRPENSRFDEHGPRIAAVAWVLNACKSCFIFLDWYQGLLVFLGIWWGCDMFWAVNVLANFSQIGWFSSVSPRKLATKMASMTHFCTFGWYLEVAPLNAFR